MTPILPQADPVSDSLTVQYLDQDIFAIPHPAIHWLRQCCDKAIHDYAAEAGLSCRPDFELLGWVSIDRPGDYHNLHNHPHSWLSGT